MKIKTLGLAILLAAGFLASSATADQPKSYRITIGAVSKVGQAELQPGEYRLVVDEPKVRFIEQKSGKSVELDAKVESGDRKFDSTEIRSAQVDGASQIREIRIGGTKTRIAFD
ncbi:conserved exported hypothetical protein [Candidatus Sulfopaludibacter sp. SbA6]|nr:conserved exported hypothetical protein [Candidatus Sulfopaludibacter sp. SbA6]